MVQTRHGGLTRIIASVMSRMKNTSTTSNTPTTPARLLPVRLEHAHHVHETGIAHSSKGKQRL